MWVISDAQRTSNEGQLLHTELAQIIAATDCDCLGNSLELWNIETVKGVRDECQVTIDLIEFGEQNAFNISEISRFQSLQFAELKIGVSKIWA